MKNKSCLAIAGLFVAQCLAPAAHAAGGIPGILVQVSPILSTVPAGSMGNLGSVSLHTLGLDSIPVVGAVAGTVTLQEGLGLLESVSVVQGGTLPALPGLPGLPSGLPALGSQ